MLHMDSCKEKARIVKYDHHHHYLYFQINLANQ